MHGIERACWCVAGDGKDKGPQASFAVSPGHVGQVGPSEKVVPPHTLRDLLDTALHQYLRRVNTIRDAFELKTDLVSAIESLPGRTKHALVEFDRSVLKPIKSILRTSGLEQWEVGRYLIALHAPDANRLAVARNPRLNGLFSNPYSGMTNAEAAKIVADAHAGPNAAAFKSIATIMRRVSEDKLNRLVESDLLSKEEADQWRADLGPNYISMRGSEYDLPERRFEAPPRSGIRGPESKRRGDKSNASYAEVIPNTISGALSKIVRAHANEVAKTVGDFVQEPRACRASAVGGNFVAR